MNEEGLTLLIHAMSERGQTPSTHGRRLIVDHHDRQLRLEGRQRREQVEHTVLLGAAGAREDESSGTAHVAGTLGDR